jgi:hypothetical protein
MALATTQALAVVVQSALPLVRFLLVLFFPVPQKQAAERSGYTLPS